MREQGTAVQDMAKEQVQCFGWAARGLRHPSTSAPRLCHPLDVPIMRMQEWNATMIPVCIGDNDINMYMQLYIHMFCISNTCACMLRINVILCLG